MALEETKDGGNYIAFKASIGCLAIKANSDTPKAKPRTYKDQKTEEEKTVWELRYKSLRGMLVGIEVDTTGDYGTQLKLTIRDGIDDLIFAVPLNKGWGQKIAEAIPNVDLEKEVVFTAYGDFTTDDGKEIQAGVSLKQGDEKVPSKFNTYDEKKKTWVVSEGFPEVDQDKIPDQSKKAKYTKFWNDHFFAIEEFLADYLETNHKLEAPAVELAEEDKEDF